ncbi:PREDICTED: uncharacterized protein LOC105565010 [Vollenhovia emeryi]|uniref:uncharacterized protein LOC105565010 n=1 Tax=Vollenhovia emeryi TaxID=411798 RepID=UPI0005F43B93|nr:PREDICTED: uncharacterized protein LOC105565010 [Vollenhovia emeryi]
MWYFSRSKLSLPTLVSNIYVNAYRQTRTFSPTSNLLLSPCRSLRHLLARHLSLVAGKLCDSTLRQYNPALKSWWNFCERWKRNPFHAGIEAIQYLSQRFENGASYGTLNMARSAISLIILVNSSNNPILTRFLKGVFKLKPTRAKYNSIWDIEVVLKWTEKLKPIDTFDLKHLSYKLVILLALATAHRVQTLASIKIKDIFSSQKGVQIRITKAIKTSKAGAEQPNFFLPFFKETHKTCVARAIIHYLAATKDLRGDVENLFITIIMQQAHNPLVDG